MVFASELAAVVGLNPYKQLAQVMHHMVCKLYGRWTQRVYGRPDPDPDPDPVTL